MTAWRYARVSTADQHLDAQVDALRAAGVDEAHLVTEHASGARARQADADALTDTAGAIMTTARTLEATAALLDRLGALSPAADMALEYAVAAWWADNHEHTALEWESVGVRVATD